MLPVRFWQANKEPEAVMSEEWVRRDVEIVNKKGLHARATAKFVQCADGFNADITVTRSGETVGGTSIMGILTLGAGIGSTITLAARGEDAEAAITALATLVADRFGEDE